MVRDTQSSQGEKRQRALNCGFQGICVTSNTLTEHSIIITIERDIDNNIDRFSGSQLVGLLYIYNRHEFLLYLYSVRVSKCVQHEPKQIQPTSQLNLSIRSILYCNVTLCHRTNPSLPWFNPTGTTMKTRCSE